MKTLIITDLSRTEELDRKAMASVHGGMGKGMPYYDWAGPQFSFEKTDFNFNASQMLGQTQNTTVNNGNNVAFADNITSTVTPHQTGTNTINFGH
jgi:hypothetical protein